MRAVLYARVSTDRQAEGDRQSLPAQREAFLARCSERGYTSQSEYVEAESGRKNDRPAYQRMLADARADRLDVIVVTYLDRFGRDQWEVVTALGELRRLGISVDAIYEDTSEFLMVALSAWKAEQESRRIGERVKLTMARAAREGIWQGGPAPYGYRVEDKRLVIDQVEAEVVRGIYREYTEHNRSILQITRSLNASEAPTRTGTHWSPSTVGAMLTRRLYTGVSTWGRRSGLDSRAPLSRADERHSAHKDDSVVPPHSGESPRAERQARITQSIDIVEGVHPAIIDVGTYEAARARAALKRTLPAGRTQVSAYLLSGLVYCGHCGGRMLGHRTTDRTGAVNRGYVCAKHRRHGTCQLNYHTAARLESAITEALAELAGDWQKRQERIEDEVSRLRENQRQIEARLEQIPADLDRTFDVFRRGAFGDEAQFQRASRSLVDEQKRLEAERSRLTDAIERAALSITALAIPVGPSPAQQKAHLQQAIERITCVQGEPPSIRIRT